MIYKNRTKTNELSSGIKGFKKGIFLLFSLQAYVIVLVSWGGGGVSQDVLQMFILSANLAYDSLSLIN